MQPGALEDFQVGDAERVAEDAENPREAGVSWRLSGGEKPLVLGTYEGRYGAHTATARVWVRSAKKVSGTLTLWAEAHAPGDVLGEYDVSFPLVKGKKWRVVELPIDVPAQSTALRIGIELEADGEVWIDGLELERDGSLAAPVEPAEAAEVASGVELPDTTDAVVDNLTVLGKVWGYVKVHHPAVASGAVDPDLGVLDVLADVASAESAEARDARIVEWVDGLGERPACEGCVVTDDARQVSDLGWIDALSAPLQDALRSVHAARPRGYRAGWGRPAMNGNLDVSLETTWPGERDAALRLLTMYRVWNHFEYYGPYRDLAEGDWHAVLPTAVRAALEAPTREDFQRALAAALQPMADGHAMYGKGWNVPPPTGRCRVRATAVLAGETPVVTWSAVEGLEPGDTVVAIDGTPVADLLAEMKPYYAAPNVETLHRNLGFRLLNGECGPATITTDRGEVETERIKKAKLAYTDVALRELGEGVFYVGLAEMNKGSEDAWLKGRALIVDARAAPPAGFTVFSLGGRLVDAPTPFSRSWQYDTDNPGFVVPRGESVLQPKAPHYEGEVIVLVDADAQSSAEYHAMAFQAGPRTTVIGGRSAGSDGDILRLPIPGDENVSLAGLGVGYPDGSASQRVGVKRDVELERSVEGLKAGRDEVLEAALRKLHPEMDEAELIELARPIWPETKKAD